MASLWRHTVRDLVAAAEGFQWRERHAWERQAWLASVLLHAWVKDAPSPQALLGEVPDPQAAEQALEALTGHAPSSVEQLDAAYQRQAARKANGR